MSPSRHHLSLLPDTAYAAQPAYEPAPVSWDGDGWNATSWSQIALGEAPGGEESWRLDALCAETDPEAFFPEKGGSTREAKRVCSGCSVRAECLEFALANDERFGIWGGLSERERRRVRLQRRTSLSA
ncbi:WhiB family transcriptional regulator, redox-sensing transcriptional regulator [Geodermatophilus telluris]|uniref:Transcriptional regulator WhiB n=1 Tax=Geodermatophilus telluris TaxID=1190417 RepID=A0A1G6V6B3_9ACTN|nr:WhiB family transcriptional regulator, redox-sensing transcriptional regulator [Geodermatophilus telluris]